MKTVGKHLDINICLYSSLCICDAEKYCIYWRGYSACILVSMQLAFFSIKWMPEYCSPCLPENFSLLHVFMQALQL